MLTRRANAPALIHLAGHLSLVAALGAGIALRVPGWPVLLPVQGIVLCFLFALEHETTHRTVFTSDRANDLAGRLAGLAIALPFTWFRYFHLAHHRHTNDTARDPELAGGGAPSTLLGWIWHVSGLPYWWGMCRQLLCHASGRADDPWLPAARRGQVITEARWMLAVYGLTAASVAYSPLALWVWLVPVLLGQPVLRLYLLAEHGHCARVTDMFRNTRTTFTNRLVRFLAWNMPYHVEHHVLPSVPFHRLPDLHDEMKAHLRMTSPGYAAFTRTYLKTIRRAG